MHIVTASPRSRQARTGFTRCVTVLVVVTAAAAFGLGYHILLLSVATRLQAGDGFISEDQKHDPTSMSTAATSASPAVGVYHNYIEDDPTLPVIPFMAPESLDAFGLTSDGNTTPFAVNMPYVTLWRSRPRLVVCGVLGTDDEARRVMREAQRMTWGAHSQVATRANNFTGTMFVLYVQSLRWHGPPYVSPRMRAEMKRWQDTLLLSMVTPARMRRRAPGEGGEYGEAFQALNSRKDILFFRYVYHTFPTCPFIAKLDDDTFVYVPEFLRTVWQLPRVSTMYGFLRGSTRRPFYWGHLMLLTRDVAMEVATEPTAQLLAAIPFTAGLRHRYQSLEFFREDLMIGYVLYALYGPQGHPRKPSPAQPPALMQQEQLGETEQVAPPTGWGAAYTAYLQNPKPEGRTGTVAGFTPVDVPIGAIEPPDQRYMFNVTYHFPHPGILDRGRILMVGDNCRIAPLWPLPGEAVGDVAQHYAITMHDHLTVMAELERKERLGQLRRPRRATVLRGSNFTYRVQFMDVCDDKDLLYLFDRRHVTHRPA